MEMIGRREDQSRVGKQSKMMSIATLSMIILFDEGGRRITRIANDMQEKIPSRKVHLSPS